MRRCLDLARMGAQYTSPNPMVGAVILHEDRIIGEGYHQRRGEAHAEVRAIESVRPEDRDKISDSTMYVSLEPCSHQGLTPPCCDLIISKKIPRVVIAMTDPNPKVSGSGIARLKEHGVDVICGVLEAASRQLNPGFVRRMESTRPHVILKFVQSYDRYIGMPDRQVWLSNAYEKVLVHKIRSAVDAIMIGTNTAVIDNPRLSTREFFGPDPTRIVIDRTGRIPQDHHLFDGNIRTIIYSESTDFPSTVEIENVPFDDHVMLKILQDLHSRDIMSVMIEGGAQLLSSCIESGLWDEAWVVTTRHRLGSGVKAPLLHGHLVETVRLDSDILQVIHNPAPAH